MNHVYVTATLDAATWGLNWLQGKVEDGFTLSAPLLIICSASVTHPVWQGVGCLCLFLRPPTAIA